MFVFLYDDGDYFAVNKPAGIHSVAQATSSAPSVAAELLAQYPQLRTASSKPLDAGLINRLDLETSGILLGAFTRKSWELFSALLKKGGIEKCYLVILEGELSSSQQVESWLGSPHRGAKKVRVYRSKPSAKDRALAAKSLLEPISFNAEFNITLASVFAPTARRHQVRAHCASIGHPLLGDSLYGAARSYGETFPAATPRGFFLHAQTAHFTHPQTGRAVKIEAPVEHGVLDVFSLSSPSSLT